MVLLGMRKPNTWGKPPRRPSHNEETLKKLLWQDKILRTPNGCWEWLGCKKDKQGYGKVRWKGKTMTTHRVSYILAHGPIDSYTVIMHLCDNPPCVNPLHLKAGTHGENFRDMWAKQRANVTFEKRFRPAWRYKREIKLNGLLAEAIRNLVTQCHWTHARLALALSVNKATVSRVINGKTWNGSK